MQSHDTGNLSSNNLPNLLDRVRSATQFGDNLSQRYMQNNKNFMSDSLSPERMAGIPNPGGVKISFRKSPFYQKQRTKVTRSNAARLSVMQPSAGSRTSSFMPMSAQQEKQIDEKY